MLAPLALRGATLQQSGEDTRQAVAYLPVDLLEYARGLAREIANSGDGTCHAGQVGKYLDDLGFTIGNWMGSVFRGGEWEPTESVVRSERPIAKGRLLRVWRHIRPQERVSPDPHRSVGLVEKRVPERSHEATEVSEEGPHSLPVRSRDVQWSVEDYYTSQKVRLPEDYKHLEYTGVDPWRFRSTSEDWI